MGGGDHGGGGGEGCGGRVLGVRIGRGWSVGARVARRRVGAWRGGFGGGRGGVEVELEDGGGGAAGGFGAAAAGLAGAADLVEGAEGADAGLEEEDVEAEGVDLAEAGEDVAELGEGGPVGDLRGRGEELAGDVVGVHVRIEEHGEEAGEGVGGVGRADVVVEGGHGVNLAARGGNGRGERARDASWRAREVGGCGTRTGGAVASGGRGDRIRAARASPGGPWAGPSRGTPGGGSRSVAGNREKKTARGEARAAEKDRDRGGA